MRIGWVCEILEIYSSFCTRKRIKVELIKILSCMGAVFKLLHVGVARKATRGNEKKKKGKDEKKKKAQNEFGLLPNCIVKKKKLYCNLGFVLQEEGWLQERGSQ